MEKIILITGATSGYGLATARRCRDAGEVVLIASRDAEKVARIYREEGFADGFALDVTDYDGWLTLRETVREKYGRLDVLVNNAGGGVAIRDIRTQTREEIDRSLSLNLNSVIYGSSLFGEMMAEQRDGLIINVSSVCARHCWAGWSVYAAAKAGVLNFTKGLYVDLQPTGVRATCIIPAASETSFTKSAGLPPNEQSLQPEHIADAIWHVIAQPREICVEEMTVWGTTQVVQPL